MVRSKFPDLSAMEVIHRLTATAIDKGPKGRDDEYGYGIVNLVGALAAEVPPLPASPSVSLSSQPAGPRGRTSSGGGLLVVGVVLIAIGAVIATRYRMRRDQ